MKLAELKSGTKHPVIAYDEKSGRVCLAMKKKPGSDKVKPVWMDLKYIVDLQDKPEKAKQ